MKAGVAVLSTPNNRRGKRLEASSASPACSNWSLRHVVRACLVASLALWAGAIALLAWLLKATA
jgi:hypothetical protein